MALEQVTQQWITVALEEYKSLRQESLAAIEQMQRTLQIGLVAIGVLTAFGVDAVDKGEGVAIGLALATPLLAALVAALRLDELHRAVAAGAHAAVLEQKIAHKVGDEDEPLTWESEVQRTFKPTEDKIRHWATLLALLAATAPAVVLGIGEYRAEHEPWLWAVAGVALIFAATCWYQQFTLKRVAMLHKKARKKTRKMRAAAQPLVKSLTGPPETAAAHRG
jgi:hypothetical protein